MTAHADHSPLVGTPAARAMQGILLVVAVLLGTLFAALLVLSVIMMMPGEMRANFLMDYIAQDGPAVEGYGELAATFGGAAVMCAAYFGVVVLLRRIVKTLLAGDPFVPENISRLRLIWLIIVAAELVRMGIGYALGDMELRMGTWFLVFVIAAVSEVFRHGAELRRDAELTV